MLTFAFDFWVKFKKKFNVLSERRVGIEKYMMAEIGYERWGSRLIGMVVFAFLVMASVYVYKVTEEVEPHYVMKISKPAASPGHKHVWPVLNLS